VVTSFSLLSNKVLGSSPKQKNIEKYFPIVKLKTIKRSILSKRSPNSQQMITIKTIIRLHAKKREREKSRKGEKNKRDEDI
jgi:hypothetical protein